MGKDTNDLVERKTLLASRDIVAIDAAGAALLNKAGKIRHVQLGEEKMCIRDSRDTVALGKGSPERRFLRLKVTR